MHTDSKTTQEQMGRVATAVAVAVMLGVGVALVVGGALFLIVNAKFQAPLEGYFSRVPPPPKTARPTGPAAATPPMRAPPPSQTRRRVRVHPLHLPAALHWPPCWPLPTSLAA